MGQHKRPYTCPGINGVACTAKVTRPTRRCPSCAKIVHAARMLANYYENKETFLAYGAKYYQEHKDEKAASGAIWFQENREACRARDARRRVRVIVSMTSEDRELSVAYRLAIANDPCHYCGDPGEEDDHYISLVNGGTDHWWNLVRACLRCNRRKHTTNGDDFLDRMYHSGLIGELAKDKQ